MADRNNRRFDPDAAGADAMSARNAFLAAKESKRERKDVARVSHPRGWALCGARTRVGDPRHIGRLQRGSETRATSLTTRVGDPRHINDSRLWGTAPCPARH